MSERGVATQPAVTLSDLVRGIDGLRIVGDARTIVRAVTNVSQEVVPGSLFVAIRGRDFDGHRFVADAVARGAVAVVVAEPVDADIAQVLAVDPRAALAQLAAALYGHPSRELRVIGVTGTDGKTTTCHLLEHMLTRAGRRTALIGTLGAGAAGHTVQGNDRLTTPQANDLQRMLRGMVDSGTDDVIIEASSLGLSMRRLDLVDFAAAVVTNITVEHLEYHGDYEAYREAKATLVKRVVQAGGPVAVNLDDAGSGWLTPLIPPAQLLTYGTGPGPDVWADRLDLRADATHFTLHTPAGSSGARLPLPGAFNISNALAAAAVALTLGVDQDTVVSALEDAPAVPGRMVAIDEGQPFTVYVDYAHTIAAVGSVLKHLRSQHPDGRLIAVTGSGLHPDQWKRPLLAREVVGRTDLAVFCAGDARYESPVEVVADLTAGARAAGAIHGRDFVDIPDRRAAITFAVEAARPGDVVAILGKGHENALTNRDRREPWHEEEVVRTAITGALHRLGTTR